MLGARNFHVFSGAIVTCCAACRSELDGLLPPAGHGRQWRRQDHAAAGPAAGRPGGRRAAVARVRRPHARPGLSRQAGLPGPRCAPEGRPDRAREHRLRGRAASRACRWTGRRRSRRSRGHRLADRRCARCRRSQRRQVAFAACGSAACPLVDPSTSQTPTSTPGAGTGRRTDRATPPAVAWWSRPFTRNCRARLRPPG